MKTSHAISLAAAWILSFLSSSAFAFDAQSAYRQAQRPDTRVFSVPDDASEPIVYERRAKDGTLCRMYPNRLATAATFECFGSMGSESRAENFFRQLEPISRGIRYFPPRQGKENWVSSEATEMGVLCFRHLIPTGPAPKAPFWSRRAIPVPTRAHYECFFKII